VKECEFVNKRRVKSVEKEGKCCAKKKYLARFKTH